MLSCMKHAVFAHAFAGVAYIMYSSAFSEEEDPPQIVIETLAAHGHHTIKNFSRTCHMSKLSADPSELGLALLVLP